MYHSASICTRKCAFVCVCVRAWKRERESMKAWLQGYTAHTSWHTHSYPEHVCTWLSWSLVRVHPWHAFYMHICHTHITHITAPCHPHSPCSSYVSYSSAEQAHMLPLVQLSEEKKKKKLLRDEYMLTRKKSSSVNHLLSYCIILI